MQHLRLKVKNTTIEVSYIIEMLWSCGIQNFRLEATLIICSPALGGPTPCVPFYMSLKSKNKKRKLLLVLNYKIIINQKYSYLKSYFNLDSKLSLD